MVTSARGFRSIRRDPFKALQDGVNGLYVRWVRMTFPFASRGSDLYIHYTCDLRKEAARRIKLGNSVVLARETWLNVEAPLADGDEPVIVLDDGCIIGRRGTISAKNLIHLEKDVILAPSVLIMDHNHEYTEPGVPVKDQGVTKGGTICIGAGTWIGHCAAIVCSRGELVLGHNCVVAANAVVTRSFPPRSVIAGNPARIIKQYDPSKGSWVLGSTESVARQRVEQDDVDGHH